MQFNYPDASYKAVSWKVCLSLNHRGINTSHASIAYRKQLPPQWTVGTVGSVWQESTPSKEITGPDKRYENEQSEMPNGARAALGWARGL